MSNAKIAIGEMMRAKADVFSDRTIPACPPTPNRPNDGWMADWTRAVDEACTLLSRMQADLLDLNSRLGTAHVPESEPNNAKLATEPSTQIEILNATIQRLHRNVYSAIAQVERLKAL